MELILQLYGLIKYVFYFYKGLLMVYPFDVSSGVKMPQDDTG